MQVTASDFYAPFGGSASAKSEARPGDGLFDALLREEEARYQEDPQPRRDVPETSRLPRDENLSYDYHRDAPASDDRADQREVPAEQHDVEAAEDAAARREPVEEPAAAETKADREAKQADAGSSEPRPSESAKPSGDAPAEKTAAETSASPATKNAAPAASTATAAVAAGAPATPGQVTGAGKAPEAQASATAAAASSKASPAAPPAPNTAARQGTPSGAPASTTAPAQNATEKAAATATDKVTNPATAAVRQAPTQTARPGTAGASAKAGATGTAANLGSEVVVERIEGLNARPAASLGGGAASAALAQKTVSAGPSPQGGTLDQAEGPLDGKTNNAAATSGQNGKTADSVFAALGKPAQPQKMASGGSAGGGDTAGNGTSFGSNSTLPAGGAIGSTSTQSTSFAETLANTRPAPTANPAEQIALQMRRAQVAGQEQINIKLHPAELGRIEVRLESSNDGTLRAVISAERSETLDMLQRDARGLERALQEAGVKTDSGSLNFNLRGQGQGQGQLAEQNGGSAGSGRDQAAGRTADSDDAAAPPQNHRPRHDGALDIQV